MSLTIYSARSYTAKLKVTVQSTGKLGFTAETAKALQLTPDTYIKIGRDDDQDGLLFMIVCNVPDDDGFKVCHTSGYYSLPTTLLFKELGVDYTGYTVIYDLVRESSLDIEVNGKVYRMDKRIKPRNKQGGDMR